MNKKILLVGLLLSIACIEPSCNNKTVYLTHEQQQLLRRVQLERILKGTLTRSISIPYIVEVDNQSINITYLQNLPATTIEVFNEQEACMYYEAVTPITNEYLSVPTGGWSEGAYTIRFTDNKNNIIIYGKFRL